MPKTEVNTDYVRSVLEKYGFEQIKKSANGYTCRCKFHNDKSPSFSISDSGLWVCFSCGVKGNLTQLHAKLGGKVTWKEELKILGASLNGCKFAAKEKKKMGIMPKDFRKYTESTAPEYVLNRLKMDTISHFHLGSSEEWVNRERVIIPVTYKFKTMGYHARALNEKLQPRYYNSAGFDIKEFVFNYDGCEKGKELIVVEGAFNAMSLWEKGFRNVVATFGTKFTNQQLHKIFSLSPESIVICFDRDSSKDRPGQKAAIKLASLTYQLIPTYIMPLPFDKDPNNLDADVLLSCYQRKIAYEKVK